MIPNFLLISNIKTTNDTSNPKEERPYKSAITENVIRIYKRAINKSGNLRDIHFSYLSFLSSLNENICMCFIEMMSMKT